MRIAASARPGNRASRPDQMRGFGKLACQSLSFIPLVPVAGQVPGRVRPSLEYQSFWWHGECVGWDRYWYQIPQYESLDVADGFALANQVAKSLNVPFLVVDVAKAMAGRWVAIECNDAQESGYGSIPPYELWRKILALVVR